MKKVRLGVVGCGKMMGNHLRGVKRVQGLEITAVCDVKLENAQAAAEVLDDPYITTDYHTILDYVDAVLIAVPHDLHYECGMFFATHGKHLLMEKPLCNSEQECLNLIALCDEKNLTFMCAYPVPFLPGIVKLKELVDSGDYGRIIQMSIWTEQLVRSKNPDGMVGWGATSRLGGGQFFSHGCHYVDLLMRFLGNPVSGAHFGTRVGTEWIIEEGTSVASFKFENGAIGYHGATWGARGTRFGSSYQIHTEKGLLEYTKGEIRLYNAMLDHVPGVEERTSYSVIWKADQTGVYTNYEVEHFIDCLNTGKRPITDARSALQSLRVIWEMYNAEKNNVVADLRGLGLDYAYDDIRK
ncbi:MAG: Gfo/Idh/MocA family oxidoreductase [Ruminococcaceae bacterium]|nr:Gfo/Idh/MocA family oxidoreductase [Oscillospiraceae bacterium]